MQTLINSDTVVERAFRDGEYIPPSTIDETTIVAAQESYIRPMTGDALYEALLGGAHSEFVEEYLAAPLALYVRYLLAPQLDILHGQAGTIQLRSDNFTAATEEAMQRSRRTLLKNARRLLRRASDYLEQHAGEFPDYDPMSNILNRCSIDGEFVQTF